MEPTFPGFRSKNGSLSHILASLMHMFAQKEAMRKVFGRKSTCFYVQLFAARFCANFEFGRGYVSVNAFLFQSYEMPSHIIKLQLKIN
jgi:hypothetical protein